MAARSVALTQSLRSFLARYDPSELARLRSVYPGTAEQAMFSELESLAPLNPLLKAKVELGFSTLRACVIEINAAMPGLTTRLDQSNRLQLVGSVLGAVGSGGALSVLLLSPTKELLTGVGTSVALAGSLLTLFVKFLRTDLYGSSDSLSVAHRKLSKGAADAVRLIRTLTPHLRANDDGGDAGGLEHSIGEANKLVSDMHELLASLPRLDSKVK